LPTVALLSQKSYSEKGLTGSLEKLLRELGGLETFVQPGDRVLLKPNMLSARKPEKRVTTDPMVVRIIARMILDCGGKPFIADSPGIEPFGQVARISGIEKVGKDLGIPVLELDDPVPVPHRTDSRFRNVEISSKVLETDRVINLPKLKTHAQMLLTLGVKNLFGTVVAQRKAEWHYKVGLNRDTFASLHLDIYQAIRPTLTILDGIWGMEGHGPGNGRPRNFGILAGSTDAVALDCSICRILGTPLENFPLYREAKRRSIGQTDLEQVNFKGDLDPLEVIKDVDIPRLDSLHVLPGFLKFFGNSLTSRPVQDPDKCIGCGECVKICAARAISLENRTLTYDYEKCIRCFCCQEVCPANAIGFKKGFLLKVMETFRR
jgi:uncharacterized protein (DUF362 family)/NAD-dependent dihydropyrimidine dehydrogenase PreA subunit